jgi:acylphosphatase
VAKHLHIIGRVQGVGYRAAFSREAQARTLSGWVRNRADGSVEATVSGDAEALAKMIAWARHGPAGARVLQVSITDAADSTVTQGAFDILPTR